MKVNGSGQRGSVLLAVVLALSLVAAVALLLTRGSGMNLESSAGRETIDMAAAAAEAGLNHAIWQAQQSNCTGYTDFTDEPLGSSGYQSAFSPVYTTTIAPGSGSPVIISAKGVVQDTATMRELSQRVRVYEPPITETLQPDAGTGKETMINFSKPTWNYGVSDYVGIDNGWNQRFLIRFDLSSVPAGVKIISATLDLNVKQVWYGGGDLTAHRLTADWTEGTCAGAACASGTTWNTTDGTTAWTAPGGDYAPEVLDTTFVGNIGWHSWDITPAMRGWHRGASPNYGILLDPQINGISVYTSDYLTDPGLRPKLTITYACECGGGPVNTSTLQPGPEGKDAWAYKGYANQNYGATKSFVVEGGTWTGNFLLEFDLASLPPEALISSAEMVLELDKVDFPDPTAAFTVYRMLEPWQEGTGNATNSGDGATWNDSDGSTSWTWPNAYDGSNPIATTTVDPLYSGPHSWDITPLVQGWHTGSYDNNGLVLTGNPQANSAWFFSSDEDVATNRPKLIISYTCPCGVDCSGGGGTVKNLLFVASSLTLSAGEQLRVDLIESWGYAVNLIADDDTQANFDAAVAVNDVVYVSGEVDAMVLGKKLKATTLGLVNEQIALNLAFGFSASVGSNAFDKISVTDNTHSITDGFAIGWLTIANSNQDLMALTGSLAPGLQTLAEVWISGANYDAGLAVLEKDAALYDGGTAAGRRAQLPWGAGGFTFSELNNNGQTIMQRAIEWAALAGGGGSPTTQTITLPSLEDSWIEESTSTANYGSNSTMRIGKDAGQKLYRTLVEFDLSSIPAGATVTAATLRLYSEAGFSNKDKQIALHFITADWDEDTVTWANAGGGGVFDPTQLAAPVFDPADGWKEWPVPPGLIHEWIDGVTLNYGLLLNYLSSTKNSHFRLTTKDSATTANHPQLVIEYTEP